MKMLLLAFMSAPGDILVAIGYLLMAVGLAMVLVAAFYRRK